MERLSTWIGGIQAAADLKVVEGTLDLLEQGIRSTRG